MLEDGDWGGVGSTPRGDASDHHERAQGRTYQAIVDGLKADGIPTARGNDLWYPATVKAVVHRDNAAALF